MSVITKPFTFTTGSIYSAPQWNSQPDTLLADYNGGINATNIAAGSITNACILSGTIDGTKLATPFSLPNTTTWAFQESSAAVSASGSNNDWANAATGVFKRIPSCSGAFTISGITGGVNGRFIIIYNATGQNMSFTNEDGASTATNRILTCTGATSTSTGSSSAMLVYSNTDSRWILLNHWG
jgi:hypothetical protein